MTYPVVNVSVATMIAMGVSMLICAAVPVLLLIFWRKKTHAAFAYWLIGMAAFIIFAIVLEPILHKIMLGDNAVGRKISGSLYLYALYGGLAAGIFEETGRYLAMKFIMPKKALTRENSIMYGIGHGGIEAIMLCALSNFSNLITAIAINFAGINELLKAVPESMRDTTYRQLAPLWEESSYMFYVGAYERIFAICLHLCCSYIVYRAIADRKFSRFLLAVLVHALVDGVIVIINSKVGVWAAEGALTIMVSVVAFLTIRHYRSHPDAVPAPVSEPEEAAPRGLAEVAAINTADIDAGDSSDN